MVKWDRFLGPAFLFLPFISPVQMSSVSLLNDTSSHLKTEARAVHSGGAGGGGGAVAPARKTNFFFLT